MERIENHCVGCPDEMGCLGDACPYMNVKVVYCDCCGYEIDGDVYEVDGEDFCEDCLKEYFKKGE